MLLSPLYFLLSYRKSDIDFNFLFFSICIECVRFIYCISTFDFKSAYTINKKWRIQKNVKEINGKSCIINYVSINYNKC